MKYISLLLLSFLFPTAFASAKIYLGSNGLTVPGTGTSTEIKLGSILNQHTDIDLNSVYNLNFKNGASNTLSILGAGRVGIGTSTPNSYCPALAQGCRAGIVYSVLVPIEL